VLDSSNLTHIVSLADKNAPITNPIADENSKKSLAMLVLGKIVSIKENGKNAKGEILGQVFLDDIDINKATRPIGDPPKPAIAPPPVSEQPKQLPPQTTQLTEPAKLATPPVLKQSAPIQQKIEQKQTIEQPKIEEKPVEKKKTIKKSHTSSHSDYKERKLDKEKSEERIREFAAKERIKTNEKLKIINEKEAKKDAREAKKEAKKERKEAEKEAKKERKKAEKEAKKAEKKAKKSKKND
jgi:hypothetical protein